MDPKHPPLSDDDRVALIAHLSECIEILDRRTGRSSLPELQIKSMLSAVRGYLADEMNETVPPFLKHR